MNPLGFFYTLRSYVDAYAGLIGRRFLAVVWIIALAVVVWFYGSLLGYGSFFPLRPATNRLIAIAVIVVVGLGWLAYSIVKARRADAAMIDDIAGGGKPNPDADARAEVETLQARLKEAMALLRKVVKKRFGYVYELPWYLMIGAPGSGKTTSLTNSGLKFPLGDAIGGEPIGGVGGTRNCNWWFAEEAILIDTAGRYTTQGDFSGVDKAGWNGFLGLLRRHRPSQPINGVLVTLAVPDLFDRDPGERLEEIRNIRQRLAEMDDILGARVPVYIVLTKADLLEGFVPFFDGLSRTDRDQVWGMTFDLPLSQNPLPLPDQFLTEFDLLRERVGGLLLERLQQEPDIATRGRIFHLPAGLSALREPVHEVLTELCSQSKFVSAPMVRGVYIASGTQEGAAALRPARTIGSIRRSYFLSRLFNEVIFEEAALVAHDKRLSGRKLLIRRAVMAVAAVAVVVVLMGWIGAYVQNRAAVAYAEAETARYEDLAKNIRVRDVADEDFLQVLPALDALAGATAGFRQPPFLGTSFGLSQAEKVEGSHRLSYGRALNALLLPRLMVHLQTVLQKDDTGVFETFDALKLYGMLGGLGPVDADFVANRSAAIFAALYPGDGRATSRQALIAHVRALVERPLANVTLDEQLVAEARARIAGQSLAERAFDLLRTSAGTAELVDWSPQTAIGASGEPAFVRRSGASLRDGIAGLYTRTGFRNVVVPEIAAIAETAVGEDWVRGRRLGQDAAPSEVARDALRLYLAAFEDNWRRYLADLTVKPAADLAEMTEVTRILSSSPYAFTALAKSVADATQLSGPSAPVAGASVPAGAAAVTTASADDAAPLLPIDESTLPDLYADLRKALEVPDGAGADAKPPIDATQPLVEALYAQVSRAAASSAEVAAIFDVDGQLNAANQALILEARRLPSPADQWIGGLSASVEALAVTTARQSLRAVWENDGARVCKNAIEGRYPFDRAAEREVAIDDFVRVFGPKGLFETFTAQRLAPFIDTSVDPWRWKGAFGTEGEGSEALAQFGLARKIREAFFVNGERPEVSVDITPRTLDDGANAVILEIEGERVVYFHGPIISKTIVWPSREGSSLSRVMFQPGGWDRALSRSGPWSALRLFDAAERTPISDDRFRAAFSAAGHSAEFEVQVGSVLNPFATDVLSAFRCPSAL